MERTEKELQQLVAKIEKETDFDVLNWSWFEIDVVNRNGDDGKVDSIKVYGKSDNDIIKEVKSL